MRRLRLVPAAAALLAVSVLAGCEVPGLEPDAAEELQGEVAEVTRDAETGEYEQALKDLDDLTVRLETATSQGDVSASREQRISTAIEAVRLDLETEIAQRK